MSVNEFSFFYSDQSNNGTNGTKTLESVDTWTHRNMTAVVVACVTGFFFMAFVIIIVLVCRKRHWKRRRLDFLLEDSNDKSAICQSEPMPRNRSPGPKLAKRKSYPEAYGTVGWGQPCSATMEKTPYITDRVQPNVIKVKSFSIPSMQNQDSSLGTLRPEIYSSSNVGMENGYLPKSQNGRIWFTMLYDATVERLTVYLIKIKELHERLKDKSLRDPFVQIYLLPDERTCRTSKVLKKTPSPLFNQTFYFQVPPLEIATRIIRFSVYDVDNRRVRLSLGHVFFPLMDFDYTHGDVCWRDLEQNIQNSAPLGEIEIGLKYLSNVNQIKVIVLSARNLRQIELENEQGFYVKVNFYNGRNTVKSNTTIIRREHGPEITFNESCIFNITGKQLDSCNFVISLTKAGRSRQGNGGEYGRVSLGLFMFARGEDLLHWQDMLSQPRMIVRKWHSLTSTAAKS